MTDRFDVEPVIGWRIWKCTDDGELHASTWSHIWPKGERFAAACLASRMYVHHQLSNQCPHPPELQCSCGIYAWRSREAAEHHARSRFTGRLMIYPSDTQFAPAPHTVFGQVSLWGRVLEHEDGWRGQYAYPYSLNTFEPKLLAPLRRNYGVDVGLVSFT